MAKLADVERMLTELLSGVEGFAGIARAIHPSWELSEGAREILGFFVESGGNKMLLFRGEDSEWAFSFPPTEESYMPDARFFEDDIQSLTGLGLIIPDEATDSWREYRLTRAGQRFYEAGKRPAENG